MSCNSSAAQCVTCLPNYVRVGSTCQNDCPIGMFKRAISEQYDDDSEDWSQLSTACAKCSLRCLQCVRRRDNCQQCATPYVLY